MKQFLSEEYDPHSNLWSKINRKDLVDTPIFKLVSWNITSPDKKISKDFFHLESLDWVNIIALTPDNKIVLVDQYRHGIHRFSLEIPGGIAEKKFSIRIRSSRTCGRNRLRFSRLGISW